MIQDNIDYDIFHANERQDSNRLSVISNMNDLRKCFPSYRKFYAEDTSSGKIEEELGYNDWFYLAYPDVAK